MQEISISKRKPFGPLQLRRHVSIRRVQDEAQRMLAERAIFHARLDVAFEDWEAKEGLLAAIFIDFLRRHR